MTIRNHGGMTPAPGAKSGYRPGRFSLLSLGAGTSLASVCVLGLILIRKSAPGIWSLAAIAIALAVCLVLAAVYAHLVKTVPSGAGMFAFVSRAWGPGAGIVIIAPYVVLMVLLGGLEALIVGHLIAAALQSWLSLSWPPVLYASAFLLLSWLVCILGVRLGLRIQAAATWTLIAGMLAGGVWMLMHPSTGSGFSVLWWSAPPSAAGFASAVGQAVFLFMGFELVCAQIETSDATRISWALHATVLLLAVVYGFVVLSATAITPLTPLNDAEGIDMFMALLGSTASLHGGLLSLVLIALCLLASITSLNGAFMGLSRLIAVLGGQDILPRTFAMLHPGTLVPRHAVTLLLMLSLAAMAVIEIFSLYQAVLFAAAISAATLYTLALLVIEKPPFQSEIAPRSTRRAIVRRIVLLMLAAIAIGVLMDAGSRRVEVIALLALTYTAGLFAAVQFHRRNRKVHEKKIQAGVRTPATPHATLEEGKTI